MAIRVDSRPATRVNSIQLSESTCSRLTESIRFSLARTGRHGLRCGLGVCEIWQPPPSPACMGPASNAKPPPLPRRARRVAGPVRARVGGGVGWACAEGAGGGDRLPVLPREEAWRHAAADWARRAFERTAIRLRVDNALAVRVELIPTFRVDLIPAIRVNISTGIQSCTCIRLSESTETRRVPGFPSQWGLAQATAPPAPCGAIAAPASSGRLRSAPAQARARPLAVNPLASGDGGAGTAAVGPVPRGPWRRCAAPRTPEARHRAPHS